ncbi:MAG TPA: autotransporter-associated beta strand repeat-containing protein, partial [Pirellulales bacterium]
ISSGTTTFSVGDGPALDDLVVNAAISGSGAISKTGAGTLLLENTNSYGSGTSLSAGTLALGNAGALGTGTLTITAGTLRADGGNLSISNPVTIGGSFTLGGRRDTSGINTGLDLTGTVTLNASSTITVDDPLVLAEIGSGMSGGKSLTKSGDGTLILAGNNGYTGGTTISTGVLNIQSSSALGSGPVSVSSGAALQVQGSLSIGNLPLTLGGIGFVGSVLGTGEGTGAIENVSGTSIWGAGTTAFTIGSAVSLGSDAGSLTFNGTLSAPGFAVNKVGLGTIQLAGTASNAITGTFTVNDGILQMNKTSGVDAIEGNLVIGDNQGSGTDTVQELAAEQVLDSTSVAVTVASTGLWDLSQINLSNLSNESQTITISGATNGTFTLTWDGETTSALAYNAPATGTGSVQSALAALNFIGAGNVSVTGNAGGPYTVTFQGTLGNQVVPPITATRSLSGTAPTLGIYTSTAGGVSQMISGPATSPNTANTALTLVVGTTQSASVNTGLGTLALDGSDAVTIGDANIAVTARPGIITAVPATISGFLDLVAGRLGGPLAATRTITVADSPAVDDLVISASIADGTLPGSLAIAGAGEARVVLSGLNTYTGSTTVTSGELNVQNNGALGATVDSEVSTLQLPNATSGTFQFTYGGQSTGALTLGVSASTVQNALASLSTIGAGNILVTASGNDGYDFIFQGSLANQANATLIAGFSESGATATEDALILAGGT